VKDRTGPGFGWETAILVGLAATAAVVSNVVAPRERKLAWLGRPPVSDEISAVSPARGHPPAAPLTRPAAFLPIAPKSPPKAPVSPAPMVSGTDFPTHPGKPWIEISSEQARTLFERGAVFFDARRTAVFREGHVRGARSISVWETDVDEKVKAFLDEGHDANAPIVVYCSGGDCEDSHQLAQKLWGVTFDNVYVYREGFPDWAKRGWPVDREAKR
jgi:rhodanese-related sulfurtransferase